jgi:uncharacterized caspase-like protein
MNARLRFLFTLLILLLNGPARADDNSGEPGMAEIRSKVALVVGNTQYANAAPLKNPGNDATDMCAAFRKLGFEVICKLDLATKREFKDAIFEFTGKVNPHTAAVFYFAGHGVQIDGVNYLIPTKAALRTKSDIEDESVQINYLMSELEARQAALNVFILDACRDNPFANPIRGYVPLLGLASQLYAPRNSIIAMSTGTGQLSMDGTGRNGTFTKNLLQHVATPQLSIEEIFKAASIGTRADARRLARQQDPQITTSFAEKFCLAGCGDGAALRNQEALKARTAELNRLEATISETRAKQAELDLQQATLLKKRAELDALRRSLDNTQARQEELQRRQAEVARRERELDALNTEIQGSSAKLNELESVRAALLKKQEEIEQMRKSLATQQATLDAKRKDIQMRSIEPEEKKKPQAIIVPAF